MKVLSLSSLAVAVLLSMPTCLQAAAPAPQTMDNSLNITRCVYSNNGNTTTTISSEIPRNKILFAEVTIDGKEHYFPIKKQVGIKLFAQDKPLMHATAGSRCKNVCNCYCDQTDDIALACCTLGIISCPFCAPFVASYVCFYSKKARDILFCGLGKQDPRRIDDYNESQ